MGLFDTLKPDYKNSDEDIRKKAIQSLKDEKKLTTVVLEDSSEELKLLALSKINRDTYLEKIAKKSNVDDVLNQTISKIKNTKILAKLTKNTNQVTALAAINHELMDSVDVLFKVAKSTFDEEIGLAILEKVSDAEILEKLSRTASLDSVKERAAQKLNSPEEMDYNLESDDEPIFSEPDGRENTEDLVQAASVDDDGFSASDDSELQEEEEEEEEDLIEGAVEEEIEKTIDDNEDESENDNLWGEFGSADTEDELDSNEIDEKNSDDDSDLLPVSEDIDSDSVDDTEDGITSVEVATDTLEKDISDIGVVDETEEVKDNIEPIKPVRSRTRKRKVFTYERLDDMDAESPVIEPAESDSIDLSLGMDILEVESLLGTSSKRTTLTQVLRELNREADLLDPMFKEKEFLLFKREEGHYKLVFEDGKLINIHNKP